MRTEDQATHIVEHFTRKKYIVEAPASAREIFAAERQLEMPLPQLLRDLYKMCNGIGRGLDRGHLFPLYYTVESTLSMREIMKGLEKPVDSTAHIFFGGDGCGEDWAIKELSGGTIEVVTFDVRANDDFVPRGNDLLEFYREYEANRDWARQKDNT